MKHLRTSKLRYVKKNLTLDFSYEHIDFEFNGIGTRTVSHQADA